MVREYPSPCDNCENAHTKKCDFRRCRPWLKRYRYRQKQINAYAKRVLPEYLDRKEGAANEQ